MEGFSDFLSVRLDSSGKICNNNARIKNTARNFMWNIILSNRQSISKCSALSVFYHRCDSIAMEEKSAQMDLGEQKQMEDC